MKLLVLAGLAVAVALVVAGCRGASSAPVPAGTPGPTAASPAPSGSPRSSSPLDGSIGSTAGSDGLTVRYRDADGGFKTVRVEDFPR